MTSHTPQPPAGDDLVARLRKALAEYDRAVEWHSYRRHDVDREAEQHKAAARLAEIVREALTSQLTQHTEPVAGEVERFNPYAICERGTAVGHRTTVGMKSDRNGEYVTKSSYDALAAKLRYVRELAESDHDELAELLKAAERQCDALREALKEIAHMDETDAALDPEWAIKRANRALKPVRALKDEGGDT